MKDQLIKLHDEFVDKGMRKSVWVYCVWQGMQGYECTINDRNVGYVLLDMQTWLRKEHGIDLWMDSCGENMYHVEDITKNDKYGWSLGTGKPSKNYNEALLSGLQEAIKLIE